ncbi:MAG: FAD-dependent monooxygenase [Phycisphaeraceae bacterium]|nr:FAD-dependent monooxygenase [Phycisphaeraceae bacterium]
MDTKVLISGAGPTGLVLALFLRHLNIPFRIIDKLSGPGLASRAMVIQARTLEFYRQINFADTVIAAGIKMRGIRLRESGKQIAGFQFDEIGDDISPYPYVLSLPQDDHERLLVAQLRTLGIEVEWNTELNRCVDHGSSVAATLHSESGESTADFRYLVGCDGAHSTVRESLNLSFPGGTYDEIFFVTDCDARGLHFDDSVNISLTKGTFILAFPVRSKGSFRFIGVVPPGHGDPLHATFDDIRPILKKQLNAEVNSVHWFSTYRVHHRVAENFRKRNIFLAGDAGHIHSPAGGQGMNTGIGDAVNLAWKLAAVLDRRADTSILDTYESERIAFAHTLVESTDRIFQAVVGPGPGPAFVRSVLMPYIIPWALRLRAIRRAQFRLVSQTRIHYPNSAISRGHAGKLRGGDRLPWLATQNNFAPLRSLDWQVHVYGEASDNVRAICDHRYIPLIRFKYDEAARGAGIPKDAALLIRPDGYIACVATSRTLDELATFLDRWKIAPRLTPR